MPPPSRWGPARRAVNISVPDWIYDALDDLRRKRDYRSVAEATLECVVAKLLMDGVEPPEELVPLVNIERRKKR